MARIVAGQADEQEEEEEEQDEQMESENEDDGDAASVASNGLSSSEVEFESDTDENNKTNSHPSNTTSCSSRPTAASTATQLKRKHTAKRTSTAANSNASISTPLSAISSNDLYSLLSSIHSLVESRNNCSPSSSSSTSSRVSNYTTPNPNATRAPSSIAPSAPHAVDPDSELNSFQHYSGDAVWSSGLTPLPQQIVDDTAAGKYLHISSYLRNSIARYTSNPKPNNNNSEITSWGQFITAYTMGLIPASVQMAQSDRSCLLREIDLLRFLRRLNYFCSVFGWLQTMNYCEQVRMYSMQRDPINYRLCSDSGFTQGLYSSLLAQHAARPHNNNYGDGSSSSSSRKGRDSSTSTHTCNNFNAGTCSRDPCKYKHACSDCHTAGQRKGHTGCTGKATSSSSTTSTKKEAKEGKQ